MIIFVSVFIVCVSVMNITADYENENDGAVDAKQRKNKRKSPGVQEALCAPNISIFWRNKAGSSIG